jgi:nucleoside-triphosphatase THEP1
MKTIHILTGPVQSEKTTRLFNWVQTQRSCAGILSPIIDNRRHLFSILANVSRCLEVHDNHSMNGNTVSIGQYQFSEQIFIWAREQLKQAAQARKKWLIIDEIGPLELDGKGLEPAVSQILKYYHRSEENQLIVVVRDRILENVITYYQLQGQYQTDLDFLNLV